MKTLRTMALTAMVAAATGLSAADIIEQILVKVNGEIITKTDLEQRQIAAIRQKPEAQSTAGRRRGGGQDSSPRSPRR